MKRKWARRIARVLSCMMLGAAALPLFSFPGHAGAGPRVTVYFANWNVYSSSDGQVSSLPWDRLDCVNHAFWKIIAEGEGFSIAPADAWADVDESNPQAHFPQYARYSARYPDTDILLSIGGWTYSGLFSQMALTQKGRASFIQSCLDTLDAYPFLDGLDLDWEYPGVYRKGGKGDQGNPVAGDDKANYTLLLKELRDALNEHFGPGAKRLTVCAGASGNILSRQDYRALSAYVDQINLMTYDLTGVSSAFTGHHSPLYGEASADAAVKYLLSQGVPAKKISIGTPLYSRGWQKIDLSSSPLGASGVGASSGTLLWRQLNKLEASASPLDRPGWHAGYDEAAEAAYLWNDDPSSSDYRRFLTYENARSLAAKLRYIREKGLGGLIVWQSGGDDAAAGWPMITQMANALRR